MPYRFVQLTEPIFGGLVDHIVGELRRLSYPRLSGTGLPPRRP